MPTFKLTVAYDGAAYSGWQAQSKHPSVQEAIEAVLLRITGESIRIAGSGRTDAGVHAFGQVASFVSNTEMAPDVLRRALNAELPDDIAALECEHAPDGFHARRWATSKRYRYQIHDRRIPDVFGRRYHWQVRKHLDVDAMQQAAMALVGRHDFLSFQSGVGRLKSTVRTISDLCVRRVAPGTIHLEVEGDGFLYNMVRAITGTLVRVGRGNRPIEWPGQTLAARVRSAAGANAPAHGLFLLVVRYP